MTSKKVSKRSKRRLVVFGSLSIFMIVYFFYVIISYSSKLISLKNEEAELNHRIALLQEEEEVLKTEIEMLQDPEYIARYARENYLYSKDGEYIIKLDEDNDEGIEIISNDTSIPLIALGVISGSLILGYIVIKVKK